MRALAKMKNIPMINFGTHAFSLTHTEYAHYTRVQVPEEYVASFLREGVNADALRRKLTELMDLKASVEDRIPIFMQVCIPCARASDGVSCRKIKDSPPNTYVYYLCLAAYKHTKEMNIHVIAWVRTDWAI